MGWRAPYSGLPAAMSGPCTQGRVRHSLTTASEFASTPDIQSLWFKFHGSWEPHSRAANDPATQARQHRREPAPRSRSCCEFAASQKTRAAGLSATACPAHACRECSCIM